MSGIAGIIHFDGAPVEPGLIEKMTSAMAHRGPDGIQHWVKGSVALGQCMLRTTPESLEEHQPLTNEDESLVLVMDGRVDNWEELRRELLGRGARLRDRSDAELVLRAYETWGGDCLAHLEGDFAFGVWNAMQRLAFCARDRMGNKPLNYHWDGKTLTFASDLHAILAMPWVPEVPDEGTLAEYLANEWYSRTGTFWKGINRLPPAHRIVVDPAGCRLSHYWQPDVHARIDAASDEQFASEYESLLTDIVRRMSRSHRQIACEVSGGLDSSAIAAVATRLGRQRRFLAPGLLAYTLDFRDDEEANELRYVDAVSQHLGLDVALVPPTIRPPAWYRDEASLRREFPGYPNSDMSWMIRTKAQQKGCRVLLGGVGGDHWLTGDRSYYEEALVSREWRELAHHLQSDWRAAGWRRTLSWFMIHGMGPLLPPGPRHLGGTLLRRLNGPAYDRRAWLAPAMLELISRRRAEHLNALQDQAVRAGQRDLSHELNDAQTAIAIEMEERQAARAGIELRKPFWCAGMVQFAMATPARLRLSGSTNKRLHRLAMRGYLPETVLSRTTKADFTVVFRRQLASLREELTTNIPRRRSNWVDAGRAAIVYEQARRNAVPGAS